MRQSLDDLRTRATKSAGKRGHTIRWQKAVFSNYPDGTQQGDCTKCPAWVDIDSNPLPNGIDIGGPAIALDCPAVAIEA